MKIVKSQSFGTPTKFYVSNEFDIKRIKKLMGEYYQTKEIIKLCTKDTLFYDVGAAIGTVGLFVARHCNRVIMIEPDTTHNKLLEQNITLNKIQNITLLKIAVGENTRKIILNTDNNTGGVCPSIQPNLGHTKNIIVDMDTLDNLFEKTGIPQILKMDIEGYEYEAILGMRKSPEYLFIEIHPNHSNTSSALLDHLSERYILLDNLQRRTEFLQIWKLK